jgi:hypothetical protein
MAWEMKDRTGTIFVNSFKEDGDKKPDKRGTIMWRGEIIEVAIWEKEGAKGPFWSVSLQEPRPKKEDRVPDPAPRPIKRDMEDEIPF